MVVVPEEAGLLASTHAVMHTTACYVRRYLDQNVRSAEGENHVLFAYKEMDV